MKLIILALLIISLAVSVIGVWKTTRAAVDDHGDGTFTITMPGSKSKNDGILWLGGGVVANTVAAGLALLL